MMAHKMTGIGFYGQPDQIAKMLAKVLVRFDLKPWAFHHDVLWSDAGVAGHGGKMSDWQRPLTGKKAQALMPRNAKLAGFFLSVAEGRAQLHFRIRSTRKGPARGTNIQRGRNVPDQGGSAVGFSAQPSASGCLKA